jgi:hypothetical protein
MISNSVKKGPVRIDKSSGSTVISSTANRYHRDNVNVAQGPKMGNHGTPSKRDDFIAAKTDREPVATLIQDAYAARTPKDAVSKKLEPIASNVRGKKFS